MSTNLWQPSIWELGATPEVIEDIASRAETVTGRTPDPTNPKKDYSNMSSGDILLFQNPKGGAKFN